MTAGNASQLSDGAAAVVVMSRARAEQLGLPVLAEIGAHGTVAGPDASLLSQPANAIAKALGRQGLAPADVDLFEMNEAFAAVAIQSMRDLGVGPDAVNVNGGAIAMGHPVGASGARLALHLALELRRRGGGLGAAALCGGGGQGEALLLRVARLTRPTPLEGTCDMADMNGQVALVTGGIRGIGAAICDRLAARGVTIAAGYSRDKEAADLFRETHPGSSVHQGDIGAVEDCERVISEVLSQHGRLDVLVNNAGITADKTVRRMTPHDWDRVVQVNLSGAFYLSRAILQHMLDRGSGRIINISSIIGESGNIGQANYAAAKAGLFGLTMSLAQETARKGITVNSVAPGYVSTEMVAAVPQAALEKVIAKIPAGRLGEPDEIARVVEFLADPDSGFITGQIYSVNGGQYM